LQGISDSCDEKKSANISVNNGHVLGDTLYVFAAQKVILSLGNKITAPSKILLCFTVAINKLQAHS